MTRERKRVHSGMESTLGFFEALGKRLTDVKPFEHQGVSGAKLYRASLDGNPVVIKEEPEIGFNEGVKGFRRLQPYLRILQEITRGKDYIIYPDITAKGGRSLHDAVLDPGFPTDHYIQRYTRRHADMWKSTAKSNYDQPLLDGYPLKVDRTVQNVQDLAILADSDVVASGELISVGDLINENIKIYVNGIPIGTLNSAFELMKEKIIKAAGTSVSLTHGDEGLGNCLLRVSDLVSGSRYSVTMIDQGRADFRSPYESIAKMFGWFDAVMTDSLSYTLTVKNDRAYLNTCTSMPPYVVKDIEAMQKELKDWLESDDQKSTAAAYMMMYYLRECRWAKRRGREEVIPYLLARAFSFIPVLSDGKLAPFPISFIPEHRMGLMPQLTLGEKREFRHAQGQEKVKYQVYHIRNADDLEEVLSELALTLQKLRVITMDADNTLIIPGVSFPREALRRLRNTVTTSISTGSGIVSLAGKIKRATNAFEQIYNFFSGPIISENGARIIKPRYYIGGLSTDDVIYERTLTTAEVEDAIRFSDTAQHYCSFFAFYPPAYQNVSENERLSPFDYVVYVPPGRSAHFIIKDLIKHYGRGITVVDDYSTFKAKLHKFGAVKFTMKPQLPNMINAMIESMRHVHGANITSNEGFIDIVHDKATKAEALMYFTKILLELDDLDSTQTSHFGNGYNDLPILEAAHISFIVDTDHKTTENLLNLLAERKNTGYTVVVDPQYLADLLMKIAWFKEQIT